MIFFDCVDLTWNDPSYKVNLYHFRWTVDMRQGQRCIQINHGVRNQSFSDFSRNMGTSLPVGIRIWNDDSSWNLPRLPSENFQQTKRFCYFFFVDWLGVAEHFAFICYSFQIFLCSKRIPKFCPFWRIFIIVLYFIVEKVQRCPSGRLQRVPSQNEEVLVSVSSLFYVHFVLSFIL